jgi:hypothetical protein
MNNYIAQAPTVCQVCSPTQYTGASAVGAVASDPFAIPVPLLNRVGSRFRVYLNANIVVGAVAGTVTVNSGGYQGATQMLPGISLTAASIPINTMYASEWTWEWVCLNPATGLGYMIAKIDVSTQNAVSTPMVFKSVFNYTETFYQALHGGNQDSMYFFLNSIVSAAGSSIITNYVLFDYTPGPQ